MAREEMLSQLESIREHCKSMIPQDEPESVWRRDVEALDMAISALRHEPKVVEIDQFKPLTLDELRNSAGSWVWVVVNYEHCKCDGWALVPTPAYVAFLDQTIPTDFYGKKFVAYRQKPEEGTV